MSYYGKFLPAVVPSFTRQSIGYFGAFPTNLDTHRKIIVDRAIKRFLAANIWQRSDQFHIGGLVASDQSLVNGITPSEVGAIVGSPTFTTKVGWSAVGIANHIELPKDMSTATNFKQNDAHFCFALSNLVNSNSYIGGTANGSLSYSLLNPYTGGDAGWRVTQSTLWNAGPSGTSGVWTGVRTGAADIRGYYNGALGGVNTQASQAIAAGTKFRLCNVGIGGTVANPGTVRAFMSGAQLSASDVALQATIMSDMLAALDAVP